uniref:Uncharacterized protein n=1 Tax=Rhizophora mucronata TaxID=61149 RepID=A0A2P2J908_RHIMU
MVQTLFSPFFSKKPPMGERERG